MSDSITEETRANWQSHRELLETALTEVNQQLAAIARHVGRSQSRSVNRLQQKATAFGYDCERVLTRLSGGEEISD